MSSKSKRNRRKTLEMQDPSKETSYVDLGGISMSTGLADRTWIIVYIEPVNGTWGRLYYSRKAMAPVNYLGWASFYESEESAEKARLGFATGSEKFFSMNLLDVCKSLVSEREHFEGKPS